MKLNRTLLRGVALAGLAVAATGNATFALAGTAPQAAKTYADTLFDQTFRENRGVTAIRISATGKNGPIEVSRGKPGKGKAVTMPLHDSMGQPIGSVSLSFAGSPASASKIAARLSRRIYVSDNLVDPDPFVAGAARPRLAQAIIERMIDKHPDLVTLAMHVAPPGHDNIIMASNFGRIGKLADKDDMHVINDGAVLREVTNGGQRLAVELPQLDRKGKVIGALSTSFLIPPGGSADAAYAKAIAVRDEIAKQTPSLEALAAK